MQLVTCLPLLSISVFHAYQCLLRPVSAQIGSVGYGEFQDPAVGGTSDFRPAQDLAVDGTFDFHVVQDLAVGGTSDFRLAQELAIGGTSDSCLVHSFEFSAFHVVAVARQV